MLPRPIEEASALDSEVHVDSCHMWSAAGKNVPTKCQVRKGQRAWLEIANPLGMRFSVLIQAEVKCLLWHTLPHSGKLIAR
jgi:hypothetical protein